MLDEKLLIISLKYGKWLGSKKRIDILALDIDGNMIVIELIRTSDDKQVSLQLDKQAWLHAMNREEIVACYSE